LQDKHKGKKLNRYILKMGIYTWLFALIIWEIISLFSNKDLLPGPIQTLRGAGELIGDGSIFYYIGISSQRILVGWILGCILGIPLGLLMGRINFIRMFFEPFINFFRFIPALSFVTLFVMWFGIGEEAKIALIIYATLFIVSLNTMMGVARIDEDKIRAARSLGASEVQIFFHVIIPATVPHIFTGIRLAMGHSFAAIVGAEMLAAQEGVGYLIWTSRLYFRTDWIFIGLIILGFMGYVADKLITGIGSYALHRFGVQTSSIFQRE
jgi:NitT/TauT family transport system permease protein